MRAITARQVSTVGRGRHRVAGAPGLYVEVRPSGARAWVVRLWDGARETMRGLGSVCDVTLTEAKRQALTLRAAVVNGAEPAKRPARVRRPAAPVHTWADAWQHFADQWSGRRGTMDGYRSTWRVHIEPAFGSRDVAKTSRQDVITFICSRTGSVPGKVRKLMAQLGNVAVAMGWADVNPANGEIKVALPAAAKTTTTGRRRALPHGDVAAFLAALPMTAAGDVIRMLTLTGARLSDVRCAEWSEVDGDTWIVPGERAGERAGEQGHKSGADHPIPLTAPVLAILARRRGQSERYVFGSDRKAGRPVSYPTVNRLSPAGADLHGLRASLKTWSAETGQDREATEAVLAHSDGSATERRYQRSDLLDRRRAVLAAWAEYVTA